MEDSNNQKVQQYELVMTHSKYGMQGAKIDSKKYQDLPKKDKALFKKI